MSESWLFLNKKKLLDDKQIGFTKGYRTSDQIYIKDALIEEYTKKGGKRYTCFVDLKKAFDSVDHFSLLYKLKFSCFWYSSLCKLTV